MNPYQRFTGSQWTESHNITQAIYTETHKAKVPSSSQTYLKSSQVKQHWRTRRTRSHTSTCGESCTHTYSALCLSLSAFPLLISASSSFLLFWSETTDLTATAETYTHILYTRAKRLSPWRMREGETLGKAHNSLLPQKTGSERVVVWGGECYGFDVGGWVG